MDQPAAIITGAGRGIGRAAAIQLGEVGYRLLLVARTRAELNETDRLCGGGHGIEVADVSDPDKAAGVIKAALDHFGRIDAVVHCAGAAPNISIRDMSVARWREAIDVNLSALFYLCHFAWPTFERQGAGVVVNISSMAARDPFPGFAAYGAAKAGTNLFGIVAGREGQPVGVRFHTIAPGAVETKMLRQLFSPQQLATENTLDPADVARVIVQCVVGDLRYSSGEVIYLHKTM